MKKTVIISFALVMALGACQAPQIQSTTAPTQIQTVAQEAFLIRPLTLGMVNGQVQPLASYLKTDSFKIQSDPISSGSGIAVSQPAIGLVEARSSLSIAPGFYYGGHDFNQYSIQYAEESLFGAPQSKTLLGIYKGQIQSIISKWDPKARLLESRAQINGDRIEHIQLPTSDAKPLQAKPLFVFRFASSPKKETYNIYVLDKEIRVHRMVWGERQIDLSKVKIDSNQALAIAKKAFESKNEKPGYPVHPTRISSNQTVVYELPSQLAWNFNLNQIKENDLRYFINFNFNVKGEGTPTPPPFPEPVPMPAKDDGSVSNQAEPAIAIMPRFFPENNRVHGSIEIDAITGKIKSLNRPVIYRPNINPERPSDPCFDECSEPGFPGTPPPPPVPFPEPELMSQPAIALEEGDRN